MAEAGAIFNDSNSIHIEGNPTLISGSKKIARDLSQLINDWIVTRPPDPVIETVPVDENGVAYRLCSGYERGSHYAPLRAFSKHKGRRDGLETECKQCRHERDLRLKITNFTRGY